MPTMPDQQTVAGWRREAAIMDPRSRTARRKRLENMLTMSCEQRQHRGYTDAPREHLEVALAVLIQAGA